MTVPTAGLGIFTFCSRKTARASQASRGQAFERPVRALIEVDRSFVDHQRAFVDGIEELQRLFRRQPAFVKDDAVEFNRFDGSGRRLTGAKSLQNDERRPPGVVVVFVRIARRRRRAISGVAVRRSVTAGGRLSRFN